jgi:hypothetical protein
MKKLVNRIHIFLSHHSYLYALIAGVGIVLFWRGVWHTVDAVHLVLNHYHMTGSLDLGGQPWWDGPLSFIAGCALLYFTRAFVSSFIGNELILSGLRTEKKLTREADTELKSEMTTVASIKEELSTITEALGDLEAEIKDHHQKK